MKQYNDELTNVVRTLDVTSEKSVVLQLQPISIKVTKNKTNNPELEYLYRCENVEPCNWFNKNSPYFKFLIRCAVMKIGVEHD